MVKAIKPQVDSIADFKTEIRDLETIKPNPSNPRLHSKEQLAKLAKSLLDFGYVKGTLVINPDGVILAGHGIYNSLIKRGFTKARVIVADLSEGKQKAFMIADNKIAEESTWEQDTLDTLLEEISNYDDVDISMAGFDYDEAMADLEELSGDETDFDNLDIEPFTDDFVSFKFGDYGGRVSMDIYNDFTAKYKAAKAEGMVLLDNILREWLNLDIEADSVTDEELNAEVHEDDFLLPDHKEI